MDATEIARWSRWTHPLRLAEVRHIARMEADRLMPKIAAGRFSPLHDPEAAMLTARHFAKAAAAALTELNIIQDIWPRSLRSVLRPAE